MKDIIQPGNHYHILITRPYQQSLQLAQLLQTLQLKTTILPAIEIETMTDVSQIKTACDRMTHYDIAIFQSRYAVTACAPFLKKAIWPKQVYAIGPSTRQQLETDRLPGAPPCLTPKEHSSEGLLASLKLAHVANKKIVIFSTDKPRPLLQNELRTRGGIVTTVACYLQQKPSPATVHQLQASLTSSAQNILIVSSCRGLDHLWHAIDPTLQAKFQLTVLLATSPRLEKYAKSKGIKTIIRSESAANDAIVICLQKWLQSHRLHPTP